MPGLDIMGKQFPAVMVGVLSAGANVVEKQAKKNPQGGAVGQILQDASLWGDVASGSYAVVNMAGFFPTFGPNEEDSKKYMGGAGLALLARRASDFLGATLLRLPTGSRHTSIPGRSMMRGRPSLRSPGAAVETGIMPRKRQFFSVT